MTDSLISVRGWRGLLPTAVAAALVCCGCAGIRPESPGVTPALVRPFVTEDKLATERFATPEEIEAYSAAVPKDYLIGPGDVLGVRVWGRPDVSTPRVVVGPDGVIGLPRIGLLNVEHRTREEVLREITERYRKFYDKLEVTLSVEEYANNRAFVLGRVERPGLVRFPGEARLLEVLAQADSLPVRDKDAFLSKCAIIREDGTLFWVDLQALLVRDDMRMNARIRNNDIVFLPESESKLVYVAGQVAQPQAIRLKNPISLLDALMMAGGPTRDADISRIYVYRPGTDSGIGAAARINLVEMLEKKDFATVYMLEDNDMVYVEERGLSRFVYPFERLLPFVHFLDRSASVLERLGAMQEFRMKVWNQKGFINN